MPFPRPETTRGFTLIEALVAMVVLTIGFIGSMSLMSTGLRINNDARQMTRAVAIGQDLLNQIQLWPYSDPRLQKGLRDGRDITDEGIEFQTLDSPQFDHSDAELTADSDPAKAYNGISTASLGGVYERYWNVAYVDDSNANGVLDGVRVAVIVRWQHSGAWRRVVLTGFKPNTVD